MERQLYVNCLKIVFRLLDMISSSLCVSVCGHTFRLTIEKQEDFMATLAETAAQQRTMATPVDTQLLMDLYVDDPKVLVLATMTEKLNLMILFRSILFSAAEQAGIDMDATDKQRWWFQRLMEPNPGKAFVAQLHASLYSLLLGILDDLLEQTQLELLSDQVTFGKNDEQPRKQQTTRSSTSSYRRSVGLVCSHNVYLICSLCSFPLQTLSLSPKRFDSRVPARNKQNKLPVLLLATTSPPNRQSCPRNKPFNRVRDHLRHQVVAVATICPWPVSLVEWASVCPSWEQPPPLRLPRSK